MAFKIKKSNFDWDLDVPLVNGENEVVKCVKIMNSKTYNEFIEHINNSVPEELKEEIDKIESEEKISIKSNKKLNKGVDIVIKQIDYLYEKGINWWKENVAPEIILAVQAHILDFVKILKQKKSS